MTHTGPNDAERLSELTYAVNAYLDAHDAFVLVRANRETTAKEILDTGFDRANTLRALRELVDDK